MRDYAGCLPVLLEADLFCAGWNGTINPYPSVDSRTVAMQSLRKSLLKKYQDTKTSQADANALELFLKINKSCSEFTMATSSMTEIETIALGEAKDFIYRFFFPDDQTNTSVDSEMMVLTLGQVTDRFGLGNGANIGSYSTDFYSKVGTSRMAATSTALHYLYMQAISSDPIWSDVESIRLVDRGCDIVPGSRLSFVPKTTEISRTICTEPVCNMLFQKGIGKVLEERLQQVLGIDLKVQPDKNRILARLGSKDDTFGTIDLSSASDSMSLGLVREMFPRHVVNMLELARSPVTTLPGGAKVELHMVSSMGNAYTFPLQTLLFSSLVYGVYRALSIDLDRPFRQSLGNFAVFGDDIIVVRKAYDLTCRMLSICGFSVNVNKSFNEGFFRESCGRDYWCGDNVRGVYIQTLKHTGDVYSAINRLNVWSAKWGIPLTRTVQFLLKGLRLMPIPFDEMDDAGVKVPLRFLRKRRTDPRTGGILYRYLKVRTPSYDVTDIQSVRPKIRGWLDNHPAILLASIAGTLRLGQIVIRSSYRQSTQIKSRYSSRWDYIFDDQGVNPEFGERWKSFVELNLNFS